MLAIRIKDADLERNQITLRGTTTKSAKTRVPIPTLRLRTAVEWLRFDAIGKPKPVRAPLISNEVGEAMGSFRTAWATAVLKAHSVVPTKAKPLRHVGTANLLPEARAALQRIDLHWHDLRHEYACRLAERGVPVTRIQALLGHARSPRRCATSITRWTSSRKRRPCWRPAAYSTQMLVRVSHLCLR